MTTTAFQRTILRNVALKGTRVFPRSTRYDRAIGDLMIAGLVVQGDRGLITITSEGRTFLLRQGAAR